MSYVGIRHVDELGRIVIPMEIRRRMIIKPGDPLEIVLNEKNIILTKYQEQCEFCGNNENIKKFRNKNVCLNCAEEFLNLYQLVTS